MQPKPYVESEGEGTHGVCTERECVRQIVQSSGLWDGPRAQSHKFILSPSVLELDNVQLERLNQLGYALHGTYAGLGRLCSLADSDIYGHNATWRGLRRIFNTGVPDIYRPLQPLNPNRIPGICKVDLLLGTDGQFHIAEIDGHNKHGLGYSILAARVRTALKPYGRHLPGVATALADTIAKKNPGTKSAVLLYSDRERFYRPEIEIVRDELKLHGINLVVASENDLSVSGNELLFGNQPLSDRLFVDFPFLYYNGELNAWLQSNYVNGNLDFLIPPKPFLGCKAVLALLRNDEGDQELESILRSQIPGNHLETIRSFIPRTFLIGKRQKLQYWQGLMNGTRFVLKESVSSGMKGTIFSDEENFGTILADACQSHYRFILQEEIENRPISFLYFDEDGNTKQDTWFMRVTAHYAGCHLADIIVTARRDKKVHGAKDCLQLGTVLTGPFVMRGC